MNVFDIEDLGKGRGGPTAKTARPRDCTMCRECIRKEGWSDFVQLRRKADHFIFSVESSGCIPPEEIVISVRVRIGVAYMGGEVGVWLVSVQRESAGEDKER